ncbi:MAG: hypothetical protein R8M45_04375 [Ghiorsea sp.]
MKSFKEYLNESTDAKDAKPGDKLSIGSFMVGKLLVIVKDDPKDKNKVAVRIHTHLKSAFYDKKSLPSFSEAISDIKSDNKPAIKVTMDKSVAIKQIKQLAKDFDPHFAKSDDSKMFAKHNAIKNKLDDLRKKSGMSNAEYKKATNGK